MKRNLYLIQNARTIFTVVILIISTSSIAMWTIYNESTLPPSSSPAIETDEYYAETNWNIYDARVLPPNNDPVFEISNLAGAGIQNRLIYEEWIEKRVLEISTPTAADNGAWRREFDEPVNDLTVVMRIRSISLQTSPTLADKILELELDNGGWRETLILNQETNMLRLEYSEGFSENNEFPLPGDGSVSAWHIYRLTKDSEGNIKLYVDENPTPLAEGKSTQVSEGNHFSFGDTNDSYNIGANIDWIIWDTTGAYAPDEGSAIPQDFIPDYDFPFLSNADLAVVFINDVKLNGFDPKVLKYEIKLPHDVSEIPVVDAFPVEEWASMVRTQATTLDGEALITVMADDGTVKKYFFDFVIDTTWNIYDANVLPDANSPVFGTSGLAGNGMQSQLVVDPKDEDNSFLELITETVADNGTWRRVFPDPVTDLTVVMRVRAANTNGRRVLELDLDNGGWRERLYINQEANMVRLQHSAGFGVDNEFPLRDGASVSAWHIYRLTKDSEGNVKLYVDENPTPLAEGKSALASATNNHFRFGDTNGSHNVSALIDWVIWDTTGAFAPGEGSAIPEGLIPTYQLSSNADLAQVLINEQPLTGFDANVLEYEVMLAPHVSPVPVVSAAAAEQVAQVIVTQPAQVDGEAVITVIAEDGTVKKYIIDFVLDPTNVPLVDQASFRVFPNPASQNLTIDVAAFSSDMQLSIFNASGQLLRSQKLVSQRQVIDVSDFNQGVYIVKISSRNAQSAKMFVKQQPR
jgi:hypothetical protein